MQDSTMAHAAPAGGAPRPATIEFTGSGSEYFRIWIVNLLLTALTLGLYHPWAAVRKRRYFYGNTVLEGHAFDFHGDPRRMLRGYLLVGLFFLLYGLAGQVSALAAGIAGVLLLALWPALFRASQRFRMANTSWRGMRFHFSGSLGGAYGALLPMLVPAVLVGVVASMTAPESDAEAAAQAAAGAAAAWPIFGAIALLFAAAPLGLWRLKRYQHGHYALGAHHTRLGAGPGAFYGLALKTLGVMLAVVVGFGVLGAAAAFALGVFSFGAGQGGPRLGLAHILLPVFIGLGFYVLLFATVQPYSMSRLQNLLWSTTSARPVLRIASRLRFRSASWLALKNFVLVVLTLGLYWPFAAVATARLRLQAVTVQVATDRLLADPARANQDASGEAAGDLFGIDVGL
jgi:uncharacterized membrane protein YjgN (DUF898 family)